MHPLRQLLRVAGRGENLILILYQRGEWEYVFFANFFDPAEEKDWFFVHSPLCLIKISIKRTFTHYLHQLYGKTRSYLYSVTIIHVLNLLLNWPIWKIHFWQLFEDFDFGHCSAGNSPKKVGSKNLESKLGKFFQKIRKILLHIRKIPPQY